MQGPHIGSRTLGAGDEVTVWVLPGRIVARNTSQPRPTPPKTGLPRTSPPGTTPPSTGPSSEKKLTAPVATAPTGVLVAHANPRPDERGIAPTQAPLTPDAPAHDAKTQEVSASKRATRRQRRPSQAGSEPVPAPQTPTQLARAGDFSGAIDALQRAGIAAWIAASTPHDLLLLGDAARFAGRDGVAVRLYVALRNQAPKTDQSAAAAFALGRIAVNQHSEHRAAAAWFKKYLSERPAGALAREAAGRLLESLLKVRDQAGACTAARRYVEQHTRGAHLALAVDTRSRCLGQSSDAE